MEERLQYLLTNVNDWLKFAESKNAALLAANVAVAFGLMSQFQGKSNIPYWVPIYTSIVTICFILSSGICLLSFVPKLQIPHKPPKKKSGKKQNMVFYGHIAGLSIQDYLSALYERNGLDPNKATPFEKDFAEQIIVNSDIALWKYKCFGVALTLTMVGILAGLVEMVLVTSVV